MRVLIAEDDVTSCKILEANLKKWGYEVMIATDGQQALELLQGDNAPRLALLDWMMPELDGVEVCKRLRADQKRMLTYVLLLTAKGEKEDIVKALDAGADDYLIKPYNRDELRARLKVGERIVRLQRELEDANERLRVSATTDYLTGLLNRRALMDRFEVEMARAKRERHHVAVVLMDIDFFKKVNDQYGHDAGDRVLVDVSSRLMRQCRSYDVVGRYGGEEFLLVLPGPTPDDMGETAERFRECVAAEPIDADGNEVRVTLSAGALCVTPDTSCPSAVIVKEADALLYQAKETGRDKLVCGELSDYV